MNSWLLKFLSQDAMLYLIQTHDYASDFKKFVVPHVLDERDFNSWPQVTYAFGRVKIDNQLDRIGIVHIDPIRKLLIFRSFASVRSILRKQFEVAFQFWFFSDKAFVIHLPVGFDIRFQQLIPKLMAGRGAACFSHDGTMAGNKNKKQQQGRDSRN